MSASTIIIRTANTLSVLIYDLLLLGPLPITYTTIIVTFADPESFQMLSYLLYFSLIRFVRDKRSKRHHNLDLILDWLLIFIILKGVILLVH